MERNPELRHLITSSTMDDRALDSCRRIIEGTYEELAEALPDGHAWKEGKFQHVEACEQDATEFASMLGLEGLEIKVVGFLLFSHDIGRLVEAGRAIRGESRPPWLHGRDSVNVLRHKLHDYLSPALARFWTAFFIAIERHSDPKTPSLDDLNGDVAAWALTTLLRDLDKRGVFVQKALQYTGDMTFKTAHIEANFNQQRMTDSTWGDEKGEIIPSRLLTNNFRHRQPINRAECESYEAYMLQFLAWIFDVVNPEILHLIIKDGGPSIVLDYLRRQLSSTHADQFVLISNVVRFFGIE